MSDFNQLDEIVDRFNKIIDYLQITPYRMAKDLETSDTVVLNLKNGKNKPSYDFLAKLSNKYRVINIAWLITGEGEMLNKSVNTPPPSADFSVVMEALGEYTPTRKQGKTGGHVSPTLQKSVSPTVSPTHKKGMLPGDLEAYYQAIFEEKERVILKTEEVNQALRESLAIMRARIDDLEAQKQKKEGTRPLDYH